MSRYIKIWADDLSEDPDFLRLPLIGRGMWYELLRLCKRNGDKGEIFLRNFPVLTSEIACDRDTSKKYLGIFQQNKWITFTEYDDKSLLITVPKYIKRQALTYTESKQIAKENRGKTQEKPTRQFPLLDKREEIRDKRDEQVTKIIETWNLFAVEHGLSQVRLVSEKRRSHIAARLSQEGFDFDAIREKIAGSDYLLGKVKDWRVDFAWVFDSTDNFVKILEGKYDNRKVKEAATGYSIP